MSEKVIAQPKNRITALQHLSFALTKAYFVISRSTIVPVPHWEIDTTHRYVIASTHVSWLDPFLATTALDWGHLRPLLPCRFMAAPVFMQKPLLRSVMLWLGAYPSHPMPHMSHGLEASFTMLEDRQTIVIFPQGKRNPSDSRVHRGVAELARHPGTLVIPVFIQKKGRFLGLTSYHISSGVPFDGSAMSAEQIMTQILELSHTLNPRMA